MSSGDGGWGDGGSADGGAGPPGEDGGMRRSRKRTKQGVYTSDITLDDLARHFHQPASKACQELGMGLTIFKRVCRKLGLQRWPYEKPCRADGSGQQRTPTVQPQTGFFGSGGQQHWALQAGAAGQQQQQPQPHQQQQQHAAWHQAPMSGLAERAPGAGMGGWAAPLPSLPVAPGGSTESLLAAATQVEAALQPGGSRAQKSAAIQHLAQVLVQDAEAAQELLAAIESAISRQRQQPQQQAPLLALHQLQQQQQQQQQVPLAQVLRSGWHAPGAAAVQQQQQQQQQQQGQLPSGLLAAAAAQRLGQAQSQAGPGQDAAVSAALQTLQWVVQQTPPAQAQQPAVQHAPPAQPGNAAPEVSQLIGCLFGTHAAALGAGRRDQQQPQQLREQGAAAAGLPAVAHASAGAGPEGASPGNAALRAGLAALLAQAPKAEPLEAVDGGGLGAAASVAPADSSQARSQPAAAQQTAPEPPAEEREQQSVPAQQVQQAQQPSHQLAGVLGAAAALQPDVLALLAAALQQRSSASADGRAGAPMRGSGDHGAAP